VYLEENAARYLVKIGIETLGVDSLSVQKFRQGNQNTHKTLLGYVTLFEGLNLKETAEKDYYFIGLPLKIHGIDGVPARAILIDGKI